MLNPLPFARSAQNVLDGLIAECAGDPACAKSFPRLREEVAEILRRTEKEPARAELIDPETGKAFEVRFTRNGLAQTLRYMLYNTLTASQLPLYVHLAAQGDFRPLGEIARLWGAGGSADGYYLAITCAEDVPFIRQGQGGFEVRVDAVAGNRLRSRTSDGEVLLFVPTSPTRFRGAYGFGAGLALNFRLEEGRAAGLTLEKEGQSQGGELKRVP